MPRMRARPIPRTVVEQARKVTQLLKKSMSDRCIVLKP